MSQPVYNSGQSGSNDPSILESIVSEVVSIATGVVEEGISIAQETLNEATGSNSGESSGGSK